MTTPAKEAQGRDLEVEVGAESDERISAPASRPTRSRVKVYAASGGEYSDYRIYALFSTREAAEAFVAHADSYADNVEEFELYDGMPARVAWHVIQRMKYDQKERRFTNRVWEFEGPPYQGHRRATANYSRWEYGERAFGRDKAAVEKAWKEAHAAEEAREAGVG